MKNKQSKEEKENKIFDFYNRNNDKFEENSPFEKLEKSIYNSKQTNYDDKFDDKNPMQKPQKNKGGKRIMKSRKQKITKIKNRKTNRRRHGK
jgi:hypothetical protein